MFNYKYIYITYSLYVCTDRIDRKYFLAVLYVTNVHCVVLLHQYLKYVTIELAIIAIIFLCRQIFKFINI